HTILHYHRAFTLADSIAAVANDVILAAVVFPTIQSRLAESNGAALATELRNLGSGIKAFKTNVGFYPKYLNYLTASPASPVNPCGTSITTISSWRGPYISRIISGNYTTVENATIADQIAYAAGP